VLDPENIAITETAEIGLTPDALAIMAEESAAYEEEYDQAVIDLHQEQHQSLGLLDTLRTMFMWTDSPEERVSKNRSHRIDPT
jgi:hypothetical protein